jgi:hypothetical protein
LKIALLIDHPGFIGALAESFEREWEPYYGKQGPGDARADLLARTGWQEKGEVEFLNGEQGKVYVRNLTKRPQT